MSRQALEGVKVLEIAFIGVTPMTCKLLADQGAEVVRIESKTRLDYLRTSGPYVDGIVSIEHSPTTPSLHSNKYGITLNLKHPKGIEIAKKLAAWADVVANGFTTGTLEKMGLGYDDLKKDNPDLIMFSCNTFGRTSPLSSFPSTGIQITGLTGLSQITGWPDRGPSAIGYYTDFCVPHFNFASVLAALDYRRRTGKGQHLDLSHIETSIYCLAPAIMDYAVNGREFRRQGNRSPSAAPHGAYQCKGEDRWCAIAVSTDEEWASFCKVIGNPEWTEDPKFSTLLNRKRNEYELDRHVEEWTMSRTAHEVMKLMVAAGISAGVVQNGEEVFKDPQLAHYGFQQMMFYPGMHKEYPTQLPFGRLTKTPVKARRPSPMLGEHTDYICTQILGIPDEEFVQLMADGVFD
ncbi:MAG: CoA transferase [Dehalococcoidia bacterium]|nr:CoA transferase [Dehalococcoidia bacterium]